MGRRCRECDVPLSSLRAAKRHYRREHAGEIETPEEHLPNDDSEQRDFAGNIPNKYLHDPEVIGEENDPPETEATGLDEFGGEDDG